MIGTIVAGFCMYPKIKVAGTYIISCVFVFVFAVIMSDVELIVELVPIWKF